MGFLDKLLGRDEPTQQPATSGYAAQPMGTQRLGAQRTPQQATDEQALARYRYMLQSAPPETLEQAHEEAFAKLSPEQRRQALQQLAQVTPEAERAALSDDPRSLGRAATRAEMRRPGTMERTFGGQQQQGGMMGGGMGMGMGGMMMGGLLTGLAGGFIGSTIAHSFFSNPAVAADYSQSDMAQASGDSNFANESQFNGVDDGVAADGSTDPYGDPGAESADPMGDPGASDFGGDSGGDFGGDFGGGDFGGGDF